MWTSTQQRCSKLLLASCNKKLHSLCLTLGGWIHAVCLCCSTVLQYCSITCDQRDPLPGSHSVLTVGSNCNCTAVESFNLCFPHVCLLLDLICQYRPLACNISLLAGHILIHAVKLNNRHIVYRQSVIFLHKLFVLGVCRCRNCFEQLDIIFK